MKLLAAAFLMTTAFAQTAGNPQATFNFGQAQVAVTLDQKEFETIYRTDQVPSTCYRDEIQGYRTECHTEYDRICNTRYERECGYRTYPVCQRVPRNVCHTENVCRTRIDHVCSSRGCADVPRRECTPTQRCTTEYDNVCRNESRYECRDVPREVCENRPRQACRDIPNVVNVAYACTRPVQVAIGERLKLHTVAQVGVTLLNFAETGAIADGITAQLSGAGVVTLKAAQPNSGYLFQVVSQQRSERMVSATEKNVTYTFTVQATSIAKINAFVTSQLADLKLYANRLEFELSTYGTGVFSAPLKGHLKVLRPKNERTSYIIIDDDFGAKALVTQGARQTMMLKPFGITTLQAKLHKVTLSLGVDLTALKKNLLNPEALVLVNTQQIQSSFEATPIP